MKEKYAKEKELVEQQPIIAIDEPKVSEELEKIEEMEVDKPVELQKYEEISAFDALIRAASLLNPRQFELPHEMTEKFPFPGSERFETIKNGRRVKTKRLVELDAHGCVPLPAKLCFKCNKSCKKAPLISCDYCPLYFHQDCLDPIPMTHLPCGMWMCPNHFQNFIDWNLVSSLSATERLKYWDQFGKDPIDHEVIKLQFFRKVNMKNPPFRTKMKPQLFDEVVIPEVIRYQYENPPNLLPSLKKIMRIEALKRKGTVSMPLELGKKNDVDDQLDAMQSARKKLKTIFADQTDTHCLLGDSEDEEINKQDESNKSPKKMKKNTEVKEEEKSDPKRDEENLNSEIEIKTEPDEKSNVIKQILSEDVIKSIEYQLENISMDTIKILAYQRLQQIVNENPNCIQKFQDPSTVSETVTEIAKWDIHRFPIPDYKDENLSMRINDRPFHIRNDAEKASSVALSLEHPIHSSNVQSRAVFTFVNEYLSGKIWYTIKPSLNQSVFMRYRTFDIGVGADNHLDLSRFGICAYTSPKHAVIFYDDITKQFELLNYSEFGTEVNGQYFSCDFTDHPPEVCETPMSPLKEKRVAIQSKIKNMLDAKKKIREGIDKAEGYDGV